MIHFHSRFSILFPSRFFRQNRKNDKDSTSGDGETDSLGSDDYEDSEEEDLGPVCPAGGPKALPKEPPTAPPKADADQVEKMEFVD